jgi:hypothetical protein
VGMKVFWPHFTVQETGGTLKLSPRRLNFYASKPELNYQKLELSLLT